MFPKSKRQANQVALSEDQGDSQVAGENETRARTQAQSQVTAGPNSENLIRLLHLEDNTNDAEIIAERLRQGGLCCQIKRVEDRRAFLAAIEDDLKGWEVILADYTLPSFDGISALKIAHEKCPEVPFIFVSGAIGEERAVETLKAGATDYVLKDRLARLPVAVERALRERTESQERRQSEALLKLRTKALESAANGVVITDREGTIIWANPACTTLTGYTVDELLGQNPRILNAGRQDEAFYRNLWTTILAGEVWRGEITNRRKDGTLYIEEMTITPVPDTEGAITSFIAIKQDVTARRVLEEQLTQAQKMEAVGRLAGGVAHDFNNLLTVIMGYSDTLLEDHPKTSVSICAKEIKSAGDRAAALIRQLLMFSRRQVIQPRILNLNDVVSNMGRMLRRLLGENLELIISKGYNVGSVKADPVQLEQIIINLAVNARDAMPNGGRLAIETANATFEHATYKDGAAIGPGSYVLLTVTDHGEGMSEEVRAHLFEPFFTTKENAKGSGLGLATVYGIVKQNGGFIGVQSEPGRGSTFRIYLPLVNQQADATQSAAREERSSKGSEVVLLVEDEPAVRALLGSILKSEGYTVLESGDPADALLTYGLMPHSPSNAIDLLLTDVVMPQMSGIDLAERLLPLHPKMKVIYTSGYSDELLRRQGIRFSSAFISKPFAPEILLSKVREVLDSRTTVQMRRYARIPCVDTEVECEWGDRHTRAQTVNLSEGGVLLSNLQEPIPLDEKLLLDLKVTASGVCRRLRGRAVRSPGPDRVAVRFEDLSAAERAALRQVIGGPAPLFSDEPLSPGL
jgi:two-component system, cell cycle sensor histidine kinase and response regulator CckA